MRQIKQDRKLKQTDRKVRKVDGRTDRQTDRIRQTDE